ncbi:MAG: hypothetical protein ABIW82_06055 [Dokdonella sp.]
MKRSWITSVIGLLVMNTAVAAQKCPAIDAPLLDKGIFQATPWRVVSGGAGECSFMTANTSINFGFNHIASESTEAATAAAVEMREAVAGKSVVVPMPSLGDEGFVYQPKNDAGNVDPTSMFFYGHHGSLNVSGYLNLKDAITAAQQDFVANLLASTLGAATDPKALAKEAECPYLDAALVRRLLPSGKLSTSVPDANNCVVSTDGKVIVVAVTKSARSRQLAENALKNANCTIDALPKLGTAAGIAHHCSEGNPRAEVTWASGGRMFKFLFLPSSEPSRDERDALVELAQFAARK